MFPLGLFLIVTIILVKKNILTWADPLQAVEQQQANDAQQAAEKQAAKGVENGGAVLKVDGVAVEEKNEEELDL